MTRLAAYLTAFFLAIMLCNCGEPEALKGELLTERTVTPLAPPTPSQPTFELVKNDFKYALDDIWTNKARTSIGQYQIVKKCRSGPDRYSGTCELVVKRGNKTLRRFETENGQANWLQYGFFNFLGKKEKQLVIHTYSGGAHCCYDYYIYDLSKNFQVIYDSSLLDSGSNIGNELVPIDIDGDGVFEFYQDVMAFDYEGAGGHASASFPPAIFRFNAGRGRYELATKKFPQFVLTMLSRNLEHLDKEISKAKNSDLSSEDRDEYNQEYRVRETFLFWVYAGERDRAWEYFRNNYRSKISGKYMDEFREKFIKDFDESFKVDHFREFFCEMK